MFLLVEQTLPFEKLSGKTCPVLMKAAISVALIHIP